MRNFRFYGTKPIEAPYLIIGQIATIFYFSFFLIVIIGDRLDFFLLSNFLYTPNPHKGWNDQLKSYRKSYMTRAQKPLKGQLNYIF